MQSLLMQFPASAQAPLRFTSGLSRNGDGEAVITNQSSVSLSAYIFEVRHEPCSPGQTRERDLVGYDAYTAPEGELVGAGASRTHNIGASHCNKVGAHS